MRVISRGGRRIDPALRDLARVRLAAAQGRVTARVRSRRGHLADVYGPTGGNDTRRVGEVRLHVPALAAAIEDVDSNAAAVSSAAARAGRAVARIIDTHHDRRQAAAVLQR